MKELEYLRRVKDGDNASYSMYAVLQKEEDWHFLNIFRDHRDSCVTHRMDVSGMMKFRNFLNKCLKEIDAE